MKKENPENGITLTLVILCSLIAILLTIAWFTFISIYQFGFVSIFFAIPLIYGFLAPLFLKLNYLSYYSPMLLGIRSKKKGNIEIHNGTVINYFLSRKSIRKGIQWKKQLLHHYIQGLLEIIDQIEQKKIDESVQIIGTSYFFNQRTAERIGFTVVKVDLRKKVQFVVSYLDFLWMNYIANPKHFFPKMKNLVSIKITAQELLKNKIILQKISDNLKNASNSTYKK